MPFPDPKEQAILIVNGQDYEEWETVMVRHTLAAGPFYSFRLTCSEETPIASNFKKLQIVPGDDCTIFLGGQLAFDGKVCSRQAFYDSGKHFIELQGASNVLVLSYAHVVHQTMEFNNKAPKQIIEELVRPHGIKFLEEAGQLPTGKIDRYNIAPGTTVMDACETIIRTCGDAVFTSNLQGDLVAVMGTTDSNGTVREGFDILEAREIIYNPSIYAGVPIVVGSRPGTDEVHGADAAQVKGQGTQTSPTGQGTQVIPLETPAYNKTLLTGRGDMDKSFQSTDEVTVFVTVQGWLRPDGKLWERKPKTISVVSPMLILDGSEKLFVKTITFTQDNASGTRTMIECANSIAWAPVAQANNI
jgi:prophage tail gpP-like protein